MKVGTIVERNYSVSDMGKYQDELFLNELDEITARDGVTILKRTINKENKSVKITARFDSDQWDVCKAVDFLSKNGISVEPISDFLIIAEKNPTDSQINLIATKMRIICEEKLESAKDEAETALVDIESLEEQAA